MRGGCEAAPLRSSCLQSAETEEFCAGYCRHVMFSSIHILLSNSVSQPSTSADLLPCRRSPTGLSFCSSLACQTMFAPPRPASGKRIRESNSPDLLQPIVPPSPAPPAQLRQPTRSPPASTTPPASLAAVNPSPTPSNPPPAHQLHKKRVERASEVRISKPCFESGTSVLAHYRCHSSLEHWLSDWNTPISNCKEDGRNSGLRRLRIWNSGEPSRST